MASTGFGCWTQQGLRLQLWHLGFISGVTLKTTDLKRTILGGSMFGFECATAVTASPTTLL